MAIIVLYTEETALPPAIEAAWLGGLPQARRAELAGWPDVRARQCSLLGSRLLRDGLRRLGHPADSLMGLRYSQHGKPSLGLAIDFSLSHCAGRVLCALSTDGPVGVDVEPVGKLTAAEFNRYLTAEERAWAGDDPERFIALWTRKEAIVKAAGTRGIAGLGEVRVGGDRAMYSETCWHTAPVPVDAGYVAHIAQAAPFLASPVTRRLGFDALLVG